jgi:2-methylcitrate dehydratase PrpD
MDAIVSFAKTVKNTGYEDLPKAAVDAAKNEILDSLATALGGSSKLGVGELVDIVSEWGGKQQSTIIAHGIKCPAPNAAQVNSTMIHALDFDDGNPLALVHTGCISVSTCFAVAERMGKASGKELIVAIALGADLMARLALATRPGTSLVSAGWHPTAVNGYLAATAMAGRLMRLSEEQLRNALGIAYHQCAGNLQAVADGALTKRMGPGFASRGGIMSALMAERGITGAKEPLEGKVGLFNLYHGGDYDPKMLTENLGEQFMGVDVGFKPYPCCGLTHPFIDATFSLIAKHGINAENVENIEAFAGEAAYSLCVPAEVKCSPRNIVDAQFSVPWAIATALVRGHVGVDDFTDGSIKSGDVLNVSRKVTGQLDSSLNRHGVGPGRVVVTMKNGAEYSQEVEHALGSIEKPMVFEDITRKFRDCAPRSIKPLPAVKIEEVISMVQRLEVLDDATEIIRILG